jgi:hypothetical protein
MSKESTALLREGLRSEFKDNTVRASEVTFRPGERVVLSQEESPDAAAFRFIFTSGFIYAIAVRRVAGIESWPQSRSPLTFGLVFSIHIDNRRGQKSHYNAMIVA